MDMFIKMQRSGEDFPEKVIQILLRCLWRHSCLAWCIILMIGEITWVMACNGNFNNNFLSLIQMLKVGDDVWEGGGEGRSVGGWRRQLRLWARQALSFPLKLWAVSTSSFEDSAKVLSCEDVELRALNCKQAQFSAVSHGPWVMLCLHVKPWAQIKKGQLLIFKPVL